MSLSLDLPHEFALYASVHHYKLHATLLFIDDVALRFRLANVLRIAKGDIIILFDDTHARKIRIEDITKNNIQGTLLSTTAHIQRAQEITLLLPLLQRESLEAVLTAAGVYGVAHVQLVATAKSRGDKALDLERLMRIVHAAQEQSKQFLPVKISPVVPLEKAVSQLSSTTLSLVAARHGASIVPYIASIKQSQNIALCVGPEGDLLAQEYDLLYAHNFKGITLGSSVLKSCDAVALMCGMLQALQV